MGKSPICLRSPTFGVGRHQSNHRIVKSTQAQRTQVPHKAEQARIVPVRVGVRDYKRTSHPIFSLFSSEERALHPESTATHTVRGPLPLTVYIPAYPRVWC